MFGMGCTGTTSIRKEGVGKRLSVLLFICDLILETDQVVTVGISI